MIVQLGLLEKIVKRRALILSLDLVAKKLAFAPDGIVIFLQAVQTCIMVSVDIF